MVQVCLFVTIFLEIDWFLFLILIWEENHAKSQISAQEIYFLPSYAQTEDSFHYKQVTCYRKIKTEMVFYCCPKILFKIVVTVFR